MGVGRMGRKKTRILQQWKPREEFLKGRVSHIKCCQEIKIRTKHSIYNVQFFFMPPTPKKIKKPKTLLESLSHQSYSMNIVLVADSGSVGLPKYIEPTPQELLWKCSLDLHIGKNPPMGNEGTRPYETQMAVPFER